MSKVFIISTPAVLVEWLHHSLELTSNFDAKTRVTQSPTPSTMPSNVSPFIPREDYKQDNSSKESTSSGSNRKKDSCCIA
ncbi:CLUMA_CG015924, isoform A [Clunio marinus]|uniref:CLUMA_CG015924, isoform A n=1 Tax=Clunio marinus TaxID=568069 RepID=A0A1J1IQW4_9DIPT|nr:CLUMA_CG015924, isoform A [Clunio marinus]